MQMKSDQMIRNARGVPFGGMWRLTTVRRADRALMVTIAEETDVSVRTRMVTAGAIILAAD